MMKVFSYGGGVQSTAALVLAAQGEIDYTTFLFCNVGNDSENPATIRYFEDVALPYAKEYGITLLQLENVWKGQSDTIYARIMRDNRSVGIPVYMSNGAPGNRSCTYDFKVSVVDRWLRHHGAKKEGAFVGLGISLDEFQRATTKYNTVWKTLEYPLLDLRLTRQDCINIIQKAHLPIPSKSSCYFCPFHSMQVWQEMRTKEPELFQKAVNLESFINKKRESFGKDSVWLSRKLKPLTMATTDLEQMTFEEDICDSGYCFM